ncbi:MAG: sugar nucleotide-binding protein [Cellvibrionaceae bacterium]
MVSSKRVLIVSPVFEEPEGDFSRALYHQLEISNVPVLSPLSNFDWANTSELNNYFAVHKPFLVVVSLPFGQSLQHIFEDENKKRTTLLMIQQLSSVSQRSGANLILLSDYHVFGSETKSAYAELDPVSPMGKYGEFLVALEKTVSDQLEKYVILRLGWVIGGASSNLFSDILDSLVLGGEKKVSHYRRGSPTWQDDVLRVLVGVIRQVLSGAENWGVFHYCSSDNCNEWELGQEILSVLSSIREPIGSISDSPDKHSDGSAQNSEFPEPASSSLSCRRIRNNFGIQPRSWRSDLKSNIHHWLTENASKG